MDLILLMILSGLFIAWGKRLYSRMVGMKKTTKQRPYDRLVKGVLWSIFPLRFLAESMQSAITGHGSFLTHSTGEFFASCLPVDLVVSVMVGLFIIIRNLLLIDTRLQIYAYTDRNGIYFLKELGGET